MKRRRRREGEESEAKVLQENKPKPSPTYNDDTRTVGGTLSPLRLAFICLHRWLSICLSFLTLFKNLLSFYCKLPQVIIDFDGGGCRKSNSCLCFLIKVQCSVVKYSRKNTSETVNTGWTLNKPPPAPTPVKNGNSARWSSPKTEEGAADGSVSAGGLLNSNIWASVPALMPGQPSSRSCTKSNTPAGGTLKHANKPFGIWFPLINEGAAVSRTQHHATGFGGRSRRAGKWLCFVWKL